MKYAQSYLIKLRHSLIKPFICCHKNKEYRGFKQHYKFKAPIRRNNTG